MAQWSENGQTLCLRLVYYGPESGGKTANLRALQRQIDPDGRNTLLILAAPGDRTLFFDMLCLDLGSVGRSEISLEVVAAPGHARFTVPRQVALEGADAVVLVADSATGGAQRNRESLDELRRNLEREGRNLAALPLICQANRQDADGAMPPGEVARSLGTDTPHEFGAVAASGVGVRETFLAACRAMLERALVSSEFLSRETVEPASVPARIEHLLDRFAVVPEPVPPEDDPDGECHEEEIAGDLLEPSVRANLRLGSRVIDESRRAQRLKREADAMRLLGDSLRLVGASFDRPTIVSVVLETAGRALEASAVTLVREEGGVAIHEGAWGAETEPMLAFDEGRELVARVLATRAVHTIDSLPDEIAKKLGETTTVVAVPVGRERRRTMLVYLGPEAGAPTADRIGFLENVAGHLAVGLRKARAHTELGRHRDQLESLVRSRTDALRRAYEELRAMSQTKERFLSNLSHEMRSPLTAVVGAATFLRHYDGKPEERAEMADSILDAAAVLEHLIDKMFRVAQLERDGETLALGEIAPSELVSEALRLETPTNVVVDVLEGLGPLTVDVLRMSRALANLVGNAARFSPTGSPIEIRLRRAEIERECGVEKAWSVSVLDRGPGVEERDLARVFEPFEQGGELLTGKPPGIGLGLHEVKTIAKLHGGCVKHRHREGGGSEFLMVVPFDPVRATSPACDGSATSTNPEKESSHAVHADL